MKDKVISETEKINSSNEAKEYLQQVRKAKLHISSLQEEIGTMKELAVSIGSISQDEKVMSSVSQDKMADIICKIEDRVAELKINMTEYIQLRAEVMATISKVDNDDYQQILYKRYCQMKKWEEIALEMSTSYRHILRNHGKALVEIENILNMS